ncbi:MAG: polysaccharide biosynthesis protein [Proteobacteria bacterium]|nr:polysaccharide biosynthesis protein [Pseudomonadota bacterium]MBU2226826.1 polysaccharide biosynthesis protein [Pseudomonadota bacterium]MBU2262091.1 polysaccharide biosynthesis protein [Pseudomonadota bacterium]
MHPQLRNPKFYVMLFSDAAIFVLALTAAYFFRFEFALIEYDARQLYNLLLWVVPLKLFIFFVFGLYRGMWRYTGIRDFWKLAQACIVSTLFVMAIILIVHRFAGFSRAVFILDGAVTFLLVGGLRMAIRTFFMSWDRARETNVSLRPKHRKRVLIIGAGAAGEKILREIFENYQLHYEVAGFIDDNPDKLGRTIHGVPVRGSVEKLPEIVERENIEEVLIAIPSAGGEQMRRVVGICKDCNVLYKTMPGIGEIIDGRVSLKALRDVRYEDLLGRRPVELDATGIRNYLDGKRVLITGGGGSIGSELCRQVVNYQPCALVLVDASEANLFHIQMELQHESCYRSVHAILGHVQDGPLMTSVFRKFRPEVVFHAAAYKHVPILEKNPWEAVTNNIVGSRVVMELAVEHGVGRFVFVSTDKAVRPTNVMGASKRVAELLLQSFQGNGTKFMAVRFGNVVGSSGSVVPLFRRQIEYGGPVTVTHPEINRYFMTIPEAAQMIMQAGAMGAGGEIFILRMGTPVRIADMARDLIRLSGKEPDRDIKIVFTGLREGEKLYEELITVGEGIVPTGHEKIMVIRADGQGALSGTPQELAARLDEQLAGLSEAADRFDAGEIKKRLQEIVPEYIPQENRSVFQTPPA